MNRLLLSFLFYLKIAKKFNQMVNDLCLQLVKSITSTTDNRTLDENNIASTDNSTPNSL